MELDFAGQIRLIAFNEVRSQSAAYKLRSVYRWYSARFATPLHMVKRLPFSDVLTAYFEDQFENLDAEEMEEERLRLIETEDQRIARIAAEEAEASAEVDFQAFAEAEAKRLETTQIPKQEAVRPIQHPHRKEAPEAPEFADAPATPIPPDITVKFVDDGFFEELCEDLEDM